MNGYLSNMSRLENGLKVTALTENANFVLPDTLKVTGSTISTPKSYDEHPSQVKYGSPPPPLGASSNKNKRLSYTPRSPTYYWPIFKISIYKLGDVGISSNLIGSLSLTNGHCPPPGMRIMKQLPAETTVLPK